MSEKEIFIRDAQIAKPDGTVEQLSAEEAQAFFMQPDEQREQVLKDGMYTITWIEGQPEQILNVLLGYPLFETESQQE